VPTNERKSRRSRERKQVVRWRPDDEEELPQLQRTKKTVEDRTSGASSRSPNDAPPIKVPRMALLSGGNKFQVQTSSGGTVGQSAAGTEQIQTSTTTSKATSAAMNDSSDFGELKAGAAELKFCEDWTNGGGNAARLDGTGIPLANIARQLIKQLQQDYMQEFNQAWREVMEMTESGSFTAPRRKTGRGSRGIGAHRKTRAARATKERASRNDEIALAGEEFEEDEVQWKVLAVDWSDDAAAVVVWYYDVEGTNMSEEELEKMRTAGKAGDVDALEFSYVAEVKAWVKLRRGF